MSDLSQCDDCQVCRGCSRRWCSAWEVSPGEGDGLCVDCWCTEGADVELAEYVRRGWAS